MSAGHNWSDRNGSPAVELLHSIRARGDKDADEVRESSLPNAEIKLVHDIWHEKFEVVDGAFRQTQRKCTLVEYISTCTVCKVAAAPESN